MSRLATGGLIDRNQPLRFSFDGVSYTGFAGDSLASALIANDIRLVGRSFKYHRPRGFLTAGSEEPNGIVTIGKGAYAEPNSRATTAWLHDGMTAASQNRWPSLRFDIMAVNQLFAPLLVAGFYYKTFMWPAAFWEKVYEPLIRRAAGLGALSGLPDPDHYDRQHAFCDLLVIGGGPAGLAAALTAGRAGLRVVLAHEDIQPGGRLLTDRREIDGRPGAAWSAEAAAELAQLTNVRILAGTTIFGCYDGQEYGAIERCTEHLSVPAKGAPRQRYWKIVARHAVLAAGAIERPIVFGGNDRPGVMLASAVSTYVNRFAAVPGRRAVLFTSTDSGWATAGDMLAAGIDVAAVVDARPELPDCATNVRAAGVDCFAGAVVETAHGRSLSAVTIRLADGQRRRLSVDLLAVSGGWNPSIGIASHLGARPIWSETLHSFVMDDMPAGMAVAGAAAGELSTAGALEQGFATAARAIEACGRPVPGRPIWKTDDEAIGVAPLWHVGASAGKTFVDFQHDVTDADVALAAREGFVSVEHLKRYTTLGMATDQGKTSQVNGHALLAASTGRTIAELGTIRSRPPYLPVTIGALAGHHRGRNYRPERLTAGHQWAVERGAVFTEAGLWRRARWFARPGEADWTETVNREVVAVRNGVGAIDVSTLGKIEIHGPDAGIFLDRLYINMISTLPVGRARYGAMLREDGILLDDGTVSRFGEERFFLTTTTVNAGKVMQHIDYARQVIWPELDVQALSVTEQWSTYAVAGPRSRALLDRLFGDLDISDQAVPFMAAIETRWRGLPARIVRMSFSGELAYEVSVPANSGELFVRTMFDIGRAFDLVPYGTEAQTVMRVEKGHPAGPELDGRTTATDLGLGRLMSKKKDFIGRALSQRDALADPNRPALVGLRALEPGARLPAGALLVPTEGEVSPEADQGWISSAVFSPSLDRWIALGFVRAGPSRIGQRLRIYDPVRGTTGDVEICSPVFVDPEGSRARG